MTASAPDPSVDTRAVWPSKYVVAVLALLLFAAGIAQFVPAVWGSVHDPDSDFIRNWVTSQYFLKDVNPYPVAIAALEYRYGILAPRGPTHIRNTAIFAVPPFSPHPDFIPSLGTPESNYPPTALMLITYTAGLLERQAARVFWLVITLVALVVFVRELVVLACPERGPWPAVALLCGIVLAWPPTAYGIERQQLTLLVIASILFALRIEDRHSFSAALLYSVALLKPSLAIPFLLLPLIARRWKVMAWLAVLQSVLLAAASLQLHTAPLTLVREWTSVAAYFLGASMYNVQDIVNLLHLDGTPLQTLISLVLLACAVPVLVYLDDHRLRISFLCVLGVLWMYHGVYDFLILAIPAALAAAEILRRQSVNKRLLIIVIALLIAGLALWMPVFKGASTLDRVIRWGGRLSFVTLLAAHSVRPPRRDSGGAYQTR